MAYIKEYFSEEYIQLQKEIANHPTLVDILSNQPNPTLEVRLAEVATYCEVILNGDYLPVELQRLATLLTARLIKKRNDSVII